jgi:hypothetical protein
VNCVNLLVCQVTCLNNCTVYLTPNPARMGSRQSFSIASIHSLYPTCTLWYSVRSVRCGGGFVASSSLQRTRRRHSRMTGPTLAARFGTTTRNRCNTGVVNQLEHNYEKICVYCCSNKKRSSVIHYVQGALGKILSGRDVEYPFLALWCVSKFMVFFYLKWFF